MVANKRTLIKCDNLCHINVPYYAGLSIEDILEWAANHDNGSSLDALPITEKERLKLPREYIANVVYT